ncbi:hypothetical protein [Aquipseudomonas alcaligenes]|uniref:hypothetical protein n=1 Tax=Aquipseudomonas alcaligenes TaxID=43263 RepID=UPI001F2A3BD0|nr:hypothetical protein [Pseudomonas alcaligenes]
MTRTLGIFATMLMTGCTAQEKYVYIVDFYNECSYTVSIDVNEYSNAKTPLHLVKTLQPGESTEVLSYISFSDDLISGFPDTYKLEISANQKKITLKKPEFIAALEESSIGEPGNTVDIWKISSDKLCP